jgi:hypothetical protein
LNYGTRPLTAQGLKRSRRVSGYNSGLIQSPPKQFHPDSLRTP